MFSEVGDRAGQPAQLDEARVALSLPHEQLSTFHRAGQDCDNEPSSRSLVLLDVGAVAADYQVCV